MMADAIDSLWYRKKKCFCLGNVVYSLKWRKVIYHVSYYSVNINALKFKQGISGLYLFLNTPSWILVHK